MLPSDIYQKEEISMPQARRIMLAKLDAVMGEIYKGKSPETKQAILEIKEKIGQIILYE